jgi:hypothetical protein
MTHADVPEDQLEWERRCPSAITNDAIWKLHVYRAALYLLHLVRADVRFGLRHRLHPELAGQLLSAKASADPLAATVFDSMDTR